MSAALKLEVSWRKDDSSKGTGGLVQWVGISFITYINIDSTFFSLEGSNIRFYVIY